MRTIIEKINDLNLEDYSVKTTGEFRRQIDKDLTFLKLKETDWDKESNYHNSYLVNGKENKGRTIKLKK